MNAKCAVHIINGYVDPGTIARDAVRIINGDVRLGIVSRCVVPFTNNYSNDDSSLGKIYRICST